LVVIGARHCGAGWRERPFTQPDNPTLDETAGSCRELSFPSAFLPIGYQPVFARHAV
jgi:hypothetical protein